MRCSSIVARNIEFVPALSQSSEYGSDRARARCPGTTGEIPRNYGTGWSDDFCHLRRGKKSARYNESSRTRQCNGCAALFKLVRKVGSQFMRCNNMRHSPRVQRIHIPNSSRRVNQAAETRGRNDARARTVNVE